MALDPKIEQLWATCDALREWGEAAIWRAEAAERRAERAEQQASRLRDWLAVVALAELSEEASG